MKVIAEAGVNFHNLEEAIEMINRSKEIGCWATKFQVYNENQIIDNPHFEFLKSIMIDKTTAVILFEHGREIGQEVFFTPMYPEAVDWLEEIGVNFYKIRYLDRWNKILRKKISETGKLAFISVNEYDLKSGDPMYWERNNLFPLYCIPKYPARIDEYKWIATGISDHTPDTQLLRFCKGQVIYFEKHVKLNWNCIEDKWSISFKELEEVLK